MEKVMNDIEDPRIQRAINMQVRFEWGERGTEKMTDQEELGRDVLDYVIDCYYEEELVAKMDEVIRERFNRACDEYKSWVESLGPRMN